MNALLLAAGLGTRFRPYTLNVPKPAIPLLNLPLSHHPLLCFDRENSQLIDKLVVNLHYLPDQVRSLFDNDTEFSHEIEKPLGSGGAIWWARERLRGTSSFWYINGDELILGLDAEKLHQLQQMHEKNQALVTLLTCPHPEAGKRFGAVCTEESGRVTKICKQADSSQRPRHFVGIMLIRDEVLDHLPEGVSNIFYDTLNPLIEKGERVQVFDLDLEWHELGVFDDYLNATRSLLNTLGSGHHTIWQNYLQRALPESELIVTENARIWRDRSSQIEDINLLRGSVVIGANSVISAAVTNSVICAGAVVEQPVDSQLVF